MIASTCNTEITNTLNQAFSASKGQLKVEIHNAIVKINQFFANNTNVQKIKTFVKNQLQKLKIFSAYKQKIEKLLKKLK